MEEVTNTMEIEQHKGHTKLILSVVLVVLLLGALGFLIVSHQSQHTTKVAQGEIKVDHKDGDLIPNFPEFPVLPDANISSSQHVQGENSYQAYLYSNEDVANVIAWYSTELQKSGWVIERAADAKADDQNIVVSKGGMKATVNAEDEDGETTISVYIQTT